MRLRKLVAAAVCVICLLSASTALAQLKAVTYVSGLSLPVAFVQDPSDATIQYVVQQGGRIRLIKSGVLQSAPFLDVTASIVSGGEQGLLGMALPPDYATSGRFFVNFTNPSGDTVVARFKRSANPLVADPATRVDLLWSTGERVIRQPFANHNGGNLVFGPDGFLYIGMGDGGSGDDPNHNAQNPASLLGKILRIDVSVPDSNAAGLSIPADNPFRTSSRPEIWDFGVRNPWRFSFDNPALGGTGALVIGDVGQGQFEEVDYEPAGRGGVNYGWRNREGAHDHVTSLPPAFLPLVDPIFEYDHTVGQSITGGFVYRGAALGSTFRGRYFYADFVAGRIWSRALTVNPSTGVAAPSDLREHTAELSSGSVSTFGVDAMGEVYFVNYSTGTVSRIDLVTPPVSAAFLFIDQPAQNATVSQPFVITGWALDTRATTSPGIDAIQAWAFPTTGAAAQFLGTATLGGARPDVAQAFGGSQFTSSGYGLVARGLAPGTYRVVVYGLVRATGTFSVQQFVDLRVPQSAIIAVDVPGSNATLNRPFVVTGWAIDRSAASGTGVDAVHVWGVPVSPGGAAVFLGAASFGDRPDVAAAFGAQFRTSGYGVIANPPAAGVWDLLIFAHSTVSGQFENAFVVRVTVR
jgi:glucose/arabinose dehydrogenase